MNKQAIMYQFHPYLVNVDLIEDGEVVGGYIVPNSDDTKEFMIGFLKREGYKEVKGNNNGTKKT